jgi:peptidoglycan/LPS O-acetylase OafA/YrhL
MPAKIQRLPTATSLSLDVIRFGSALVIAVVHIAQGFFSTGWPDLVNSVGLPAVAVFFILSGFVIRYVTRIKYATLGEYTIDRASRIYSVVLPAILFTIVADIISYHANPHYYLANWGDAISHPGMRILANLTFVSQVWSHDISLFSNGPFWTLSFECLYYALYGAAFYLARSTRVLWLGALALLMGPHMLMLVPLWAIGCVVHDIYQYLCGRNVSLRRFNLVMVAIALAGGLLWVPALRAIYAVKQYETLFFWHFHHQPLDLAWTTWYYPTGFVFGFLLLWSSLLLNHLKLDSKSKSVRWIRLCSEGTFPLYLFHFPLFVLIASLISYDHGNAWFKIGMVLFAVVIGMVLAPPTNALKNWLRSVLRRTFLRSESLPPARQLEAVS